MGQNLPQNSKTIKTLASQAFVHKDSRRHAVLGRIMLPLNLLLWVSLKNAASAMKSVWICS